MSGGPCCREDFGGSHYHCPECGSPDVGMYGHWRDDHYACPPESERQEWWAEHRGKAGPPVQTAARTIARGGVFHYPDADKMGLPQICDVEVGVMEGVEPKFVMLRIAGVARLLQEPAHARQLAEALERAADLLDPPREHN